MKKNTTRATAVIGTTMALVLAGTAVTAAAPGDRGDRGDRGIQRGKAGIGAQQGGKMMPGARGMGGMRGLDEGFERRETILQTADGVTTKRMEQGAVDSAAADALTFSLGSGESVTVVIDDDTQLVGFEEKDVTVRGWSRTRMAPTEIEAGAIEAGAEIVVWSDSEEGADFVASRVVVQLADDADETEVEKAETEEAEAQADEAFEETVTEEAAATDA